MNEIIKVDYKQFGLAETKAKEIEIAFTPFVDAMEELAPELEEFYEGLDLIPTQEECKEAGILRKQYVKIRTGTGKAHKEQKAVFLNAGRFVDGLKNAQLKASTTIESDLERIERFHINLEKDRLAKIQSDRINEIKDFFIPGTPVADYSLMSDNIWKTFLLGTKEAHALWVETKIKENSITPAESFDEIIHEAPTYAVTIIRRDKSEKFHAEVIRTGATYLIKVID